MSTMCFGKRDILTESPVENSAIESDDRKRRAWNHDREKRKQTKELRTSQKAKSARQIVHTTFLSVI